MPSLVGGATGNSQRLRGGGGPIARSDVAPAAILPLQSVLGQRVGTVQGVGLDAGANTITITAPAAVLAAAGGLQATAPAITITAPPSTLQAVAGLAAGVPVLTLSAPAAALAGGALAASGAPTISTTAPTAALAAAGGLAATAPTLTITAPTAMLVPLVPPVLVATAPVITLSAPTAVLQVLAPPVEDGSAAGNFKEPMPELFLRPAFLYAGVQAIRITAPEARLLMVAPQPRPGPGPRALDDDEAITLAVLYLLSEDVEES